MWPILKQLASFTLLCKGMHTHISIMFIVCRIFSEASAYFTLNTGKGWHGHSRYIKEERPSAPIRSCTGTQFSVQDSSSNLCPLFVLYWWSPLPHWTRQLTKRPWHSTLIQREWPEYLMANPPFPVSFVDLEAQGEGFCGVEHRVSGELEFSLSSLVTFMKSVVQDHTTQVQIPSFVMHGPWQSKPNRPSQVLFHTLSTSKLLASVTPSNRSKSLCHTIYSNIFTPLHMAPHLPRTTSVSQEDADLICKIQIKYDLLYEDPLGCPRQSQDSFRFIRIFL